MNDKDIFIAINALREKADTLSNTFDISSLYNVINFLSMRLTDHLK